MLRLPAAICCYLLLCLVRASNFYDRDEHIMELTPASFDKVIHQTNYTTIVEFYAPWCGYCQEMKGHFKSAARMLSGIVQVAAVNCDESVNKQLCAQHRVSGFPTVMVFRPPKFDLNNQNHGNADASSIASSRHASETYKGERKLKPMVDFALSRVKNYVKKLNRYEKFEDVLKTDRSRYAVILVTKKDKVPSLFKAVALDWLGIHDFYAIWNKKLNGVSQLTFQDDTSRWPNAIAYIKSLETTAGSLESPKIIVIDKQNDTVSELDLVKENGKQQIAEFLSNFGLTPREGPLSKRDEFIQSIVKKADRAKSSKSKKQAKSKAKAKAKAKAKSKSKSKASESQSKSKASESQSNSEPHQNTMVDDEL